MAKQERRRDLSHVERVREILQEVGKVPPQHIELEEAVISALMVDGESYFKIGHILKPEMFYKDVHRIIFEAILTMEGKGCDLYTVIAKLKEQHKLDLVGGPYFLTQLTNKVASSAHIEDHVTYIVEAWKSRECIRLSSDIQAAAFESSVEDIVRLDVELNDVLSGEFRTGVSHIRESVSRSAQAIIGITTGSKSIIGIPTGYVVLDRFLYGLQEPDLFVIAARPSMGKTALAMCIARNVSENMPVLVFSMEMSKQQLDNRLLSMETRIEQYRFKTQGGLNKDQVKKIEEAAEKIENLNLHVDDTPAQHINDIKNKARRHHRMHGTKLIIVDYIQLARGSAKNRDQEISQITQGLKAIAKELGVPVIALSQLNRQVENRAGRRPNLSDLRESGAIEADADVVMFVHRPERYKIDSFEDGSSTKGIAELIVEKNRNGSTGDLVMRFVDTLTLFEDMEIEEVAPKREYSPRLFSQDDDAPF